MGAGPPAGSDGPIDVRRAVLDAAGRAGIALLPEVTPSPEWSVVGVPLGPFPARLRLDTEAGVLWHDVIAAEIVPPVTVESAVEAIALPQPEIRLLLFSTSWMVALSYPLPFEHLTSVEVVGLLGAGALYATALTTELTGHHGRRWASVLAAHGFTSETGFGHDPRDLLRRPGVAPWPRGDA